MSELTRRRFVSRSAGAAAGVATAGALGATRADAQATTEHRDPIVAYVKDPSTGEISVLSGDREVVIHDRALAARIARAVA